MIKKFFLAFWAIVLGSVSVFAAETFILFKPFVSLLGDSGVWGLLKNDGVVFALIYLAYFLGFFNILKIALKPIFGAEHPKESNTVAMMISFIGVTGMFFMFAKDGIGSAILLFGGSIGFILLAIVSASFLVMIKNAVDFGKGGWAWLSLAVTMVTICLNLYIIKLIESGVSSTFWQTLADGLMTFSSFMMIATIVLGVMAFSAYKKANASPKIEEDEEDSLELKETKDTITNIQNNLKDINNDIKQIKRALE